MAKPLQIARPDQGALDVAQRAFMTLQRCAFTGDWEPFVELLTDDVRIMWPVPGFDGLTVGKDRVREMIASHHQGNLKRVRLDCKRVAANGPVVMMECRVEGEMGSGPSANGLLFVFEIRGDRIAASHEYVIWTSRPDSSRWLDETFAREAFAGSEPAIPFDEQA